jgi:hypothetical protein
MEGGAPGSDMADVKWESSAPSPLRNTLFNPPSSPPGPPSSQCHASCQPPPMPTLPKDSGTPPSCATLLEFDLENQPEIPLEFDCENREFDRDRGPSCPLLSRELECENPCTLREPLRETGGRLFTDPYLFPESNGASRVSSKSPTMPRSLSE